MNLRLISAWMMAAAAAVVAGCGEDRPRGSGGNTGGSRPPSTCTPGARARCQGSQLQRCGMNGSWENVQDCAATQQSCVATSSAADAFCETTRTCATGMQAGKCNNGSACVTGADCVS